MFNTVRWSLTSGFILAIIVFFSSVFVNSMLTSFFRAVFVFIIGLFIGLIFHFIWGFIEINFKEDEEAKSEKHPRAEQSNVEQLDDEKESNRQEETTN